MADGRTRRPSGAGHGRLDRPLRERNGGVKAEGNGDNSVCPYRWNQPRRLRSLIQLNRFARNGLSDGRTAGRGARAADGRARYHTVRSFYLEKEYRAAGTRLTASWVSQGRIWRNLVPGLLLARLDPAELGHVSLLARHKGVGVLRWQMDESEVQFVAAAMTRLMLRRELERW